MNEILTKGTRVFVWVLAVVGLGILSLVPLPYLLVTCPDQNNGLLLSLALNKNFSLVYVHSVQKTPVIEEFSLGPGDGLALTSTVYRSLGVGLPFLPGEGKLVNDGGRFTLTGLNRNFRQIDLRMAPVSRQSINYRGRHFDLNRHFSPGSPVRLRVVRYSPARIVWFRLTKGMGGVF